MAATAEHQCSEEEREVLTTYLEREEEQVQFAGWVTKMKKKETEDRLLVVGQFRVVTFKRKGRTSVQIAREGHLYSLKKLQIEEANGAVDVTLTFKDFKFAFHDVPSRAYRVTNIIRRAHALITVAWPQSAALDVECTFNGGKTIPDQLPPMSVPLGGFVEAYHAACLQLNCPLQPHHRSILDYIVSKASQRSIELAGDVDELAGLDIKASNSVSLRPLISALRFNTWFTSLSFSNINRPDAVAAVAEIMAENSTLDSVTLHKVQAASGFDALGDAMHGSKKCSLTHLDVSENTIKDKGMQVLARGLSKVQLRHLNVSQNDLGHKAVAFMAELFTGSMPVRSALHELHLSENYVGNAGTTALAKWLTLAPCINLSALILTNTHINATALSVVLTKAICPSISFLDLSANTITDTDAIHLYTTLIGSSLTSLVLSQCKISIDSLGGILQSMISDANRQEARFYCNGIDLRVAGATRLATAIAASRNLVELSVDDCNLGGDGLMQLFDALAGCATIKRLNCSHNIKLKDRQASEAAAHLASFVRRSISLETLVIQGDSKYAWGKPLTAFFDGLKGSTLTELDVSGNKCCDEGIKALSMALPDTRCLTLLHLDDNSMTIKGLRELAVGVEINRSLLDVPIPNNDFRLICTKSTKLTTIFNEMKEILNILRRTFIRNRSAAESGNTQGPSTLLVRPGPDKNLDEWLNEDRTARRARRADRKRIKSTRRVKSTVRESQFARHSTMNAGRRETAKNLGAVWMPAMATNGSPDTMDFTPTRMNKRDTVYEMRGLEQLLSAAADDPSMGGMMFSTAMNPAPQRSASTASNSNQQNSVTEGDDDSDPDEFASWKRVQPITPRHQPEREEDPDYDDGTASPPPPELPVRRSVFQMSLPENFESRPASGTVESPAKPVEAPVPVQPAAAAEPQAPDSPVQTRPHAATVTEKPTSTKPVMVLTPEGARPLDKPMSTKPSRLSLMPERRASVPVPLEPINPPPEASVPSQAAQPVRRSSLPPGAIDATAADAPAPAPGNSTTTMSSTVVATGPPPPVPAPAPPPPPLQTDLAPADGSQATAVKETLQSPTSDSDRLVIPESPGPRREEAASSGASLALPEASAYSTTSAGQSSGDESSRDS